MSALLQVYVVVLLASENEQLSLHFNLSLTISNNRSQKQPCVVMTT